MSTKTKKPKEDTRARDQASAQMDSIAEMVKALKDAEESGDDKAREEAEQAIQEDPLSVEVRSGWVTPGSAEMEAEEFRILLCWGGPACQLIGELDQYNQPDKVRLEYQDWFTPWTEYRGDNLDSEVLLEYCRQFYFGD